MRPHVEFATPAWSPWLRGDVDKIESVQKKAVGMISGLSGRTYGEKCSEIGLERLEDRRGRQDLTQAFKIINQVDKLDPQKIFKFSERTIHTRRDDDHFQLRQAHSWIDIRRNVFSQRVTAAWNNIPVEIKMKKTTWIQKCNQDHFYARWRDPRQLIEGDEWIPADHPSHDGATKTTQKSMAT